MDVAKRDYLNKIRSNTAYPTYRSIIGLIALLGYILAALSALGALISGFGTMGDSFLAGAGILIFGLIGAGAIFLGARFWKEAAIIIADIGDSITDANSKGSAAP